MAPSVDPFQAPVEKGAELIRDGIRSHTSGLAQPMYAVSTKVGTVPLCLIIISREMAENRTNYKVYKGEILHIPYIPE